MEKFEDRNFSRESKFFRFRVDQAAPEGKRRKLLREKLTLEAVNETRSQVPDAIQVYPSNSSEYVETFCDSEFPPMIDKIQILVEKREMFPLYGGNFETFYREQITNGNLKTRSVISNFNEPFRKNCAFTTPVTDTLNQIN